MPGLETAAKHSIELKTLLNDLKNKVNDALTESELQLNLSLSSGVNGASSLKNLNEVAELANQLTIFLEKYQNPKKPGVIRGNTIKRVLKDMEKTVYLEERTVQDQLLKSINQTITSMVSIQEGFTKVEKLRNIFDTLQQLKHAFAKTLE